MFFDDKNQLRFGPCFSLLIFVVMFAGGQAIVLALSLPPMRIIGGPVVFMIATASMVVMIILALLLAALGGIYTRRTEELDSLLTAVGNDGLKHILVREAQTLEDFFDVQTDIERRLKSEGGSEDSSVTGWRERHAQVTDNVRLQKGRVRKLQDLARRRELNPPEKISEIAQWDGNPTVPAEA